MVTVAISLRFGPICHRLTGLNVNNLIISLIGNVEIGMGNLHDVLS